MPDDDYVGVLEQHLPGDAPALAAGAPGDARPARCSASTRASRAITIGQRKGLPGGRRGAALRGGDPAGHRARWSWAASRICWATGCGWRNSTGSPSRSRRATAARSRSGTAPGRRPRHRARAATSAGIDLALSNPGSRHHPRPIRRPLRRRRPGARRRSDRLMRSHRAGPACSLPSSCSGSARRCAAQDKPALGDRGLHHLADRQRSSALPGRGPGGVHVSHALAWRRTAPSPGSGWPT